MNTLSMGSVRVCSLSELYKKNTKIELVSSRVLNDALSAVGGRILNQSTQITYLNPYLVSDCTIIDSNKEDITFIVLPERHGGKHALT